MKSENLAKSLALCSELGARIQRAGTMSLHGVAIAILLVPAVAAAGLALGEIRLAGVRLGVDT